MRTVGSSSTVAGATLLRVYNDATDAVIPASSRRHWLSSHYPDDGSVRHANEPRSAAAVVASATATS